MKNLFDLDRSIVLTALAVFGMLLAVLALGLSRGMLPASPCWPVSHWYI